MASSDSTPPENNASRIASCSACMVRSSSLLPGSHGLLNPLDSSRSDRRETRSSRSISSSRLPVYLVYRNFIRPPCLAPSSVVVLLALARRRGHARDFIRGLARGTARRGLLDRVVP